MALSERVASGRQAVTGRVRASRGAERGPGQATVDHRLEPPPGLGPRPSGAAAARRGRAPCRHTPSCGPGCRARSGGLNTLASRRNEGGMLPGRRAARPGSGRLPTTSRRLSRHPIPLGSPGRGLPSPVPWRFDALPRGRSENSERSPLANRLPPTGPITPSFSRPFDDGHDKESGPPCSGMLSNRQGDGVSDLHAGALTAFSL